MRFVRFAALCLAVSAVIAWAGPASSAAILEREYRFGPDRVFLEGAGDQTLVKVSGGVADVRPGRPDLPWVSETVELPAGQRVARLEIVTVETERVAAGVSIPPTVLPAHGLGPFPRSAPDPAFFGHAGFQPEQVAALGAQGYQRGTGSRRFASRPPAGTP